MRKKLIVVAMSAALLFANSPSATAVGGLDSSDCGFRQQGKTSIANAWFGDNITINVFTTPDGPQFCYRVERKMERCPGDTGNVYKWTFATGPAKFTYDKSSSLRFATATFSGTTYNHSYYSCISKEIWTEGAPIVITLKLYKPGRIEKGYWAYNAGNDQNKARCIYIWSSRPQKVSGKLNGKVVNGVGELSRQYRSNGCL